MEQRHYNSIHVLQILLNPVIENTTQLNTDITNTTWYRHCCSKRSTLHYNSIHVLQIQLNTIIENTTQLNTDIENTTWYRHCCSKVEHTSLQLSTDIAPSRIPTLERKRGHLQDSWLVRAKRQRKVASKIDICGTSERSPVEAADLWHLWHFYVFPTFQILLKKLKKIHTVWQKPKNVTKFKSMTLWHLEMSQNVTKCHTFLFQWYKNTFTFYVWIRLGTALM